MKRVMAHKAELSVTEEQAKVIDRMMLGAADCYNMAHEIDSNFFEENKEKILAYSKDKTKPKPPRLSSSELARICTKLRKEDHNHQWFSSLDSIVAHSAVNNYADARKRFIQSKTGQIKSEIGVPSRKLPMKHNKCCIKYSSKHVGKYTEDGWGIVVSKKMGNILHLREKARWITDIKKMTIHRQAGRYWVSCLVEAEPSAKIGEPTKSFAGIDIGMFHHRISLNSKVVAKISSKSHKIDYYHERKIAHYQHKHRRKISGQLLTSPKQFSRMTKGSRRYRAAQRRNKLYYTGRALLEGKRVSKRFVKAMQGLSKLYLNRDHALKDYREKLTTKLVDKVGGIAIQKGRFKPMKRTKKNDDKPLRATILSKFIRHMQPATFIKRIEEKCKFYGRDFIDIKSFEPKAKPCQHCKHVNSKKNVSLHFWLICEKCNRKLNQDKNTAHLIRKEGLKLRKLLKERS